MNNMKTQWAIRAAIAAAGLAYVFPTVVSYFSAAENPAPTHIVFAAASLSPEQSARQQQVDQLCARVAGLNHVAQR